jgi:protein-disulfide isomerase
VAQALLAGIPQSRTVLGRRTAPVTVTFFGDLESPISRDFTLGKDGAGFPRLVRDQVRSGAVKVMFRSLCTATCNSVGMSAFDTQQAAAYAAGTQGLFWEYAELFYREQGRVGTRYVTAKYLDRLAGQIPVLNLARWQHARATVTCPHRRVPLHTNVVCAVAPAFLAQIRTDARIARRNHVIATPTIVIAGPKGKVTYQNGLASYATLKRAIRHVK